MVEGARLEILCTPRGYRGFKSLPLRQFLKAKSIPRSFTLPGFLFLYTIFFVFICLFFKKGRSAKCALTRGQKASGHTPSYWGSGSRNDYLSSHEFVAHLTAARYTKDYQFMKMFSPVAQEVQALLDSYEP